MKEAKAKAILATNLLCDFIERYAKHTKNENMLDIDGFDIFKSEIASQIYQDIIEYGELILYTSESENEPIFYGITSALEKSGLDLKIVPKGFYMGTEGSLLKMGRYHEIEDAFQEIIEFDFSDMDDPEMWNISNESISKVVDTLMIFVTDNKFKNANDEFIM